MPDHAAERGPQKRHALDLEPVEQREHVVGEVVDRVRAGRDRRAAVPAVVVAQHAEARRPRAAAWSSHIASVVPSELAKRTAGAPPVGTLERGGGARRSPAPAALRDRSHRERRSMSSPRCARAPTPSAGFLGHPSSSRFAACAPVDLEALERLAQRPPRRRCRPARPRARSHSLCHAPAARSCSLAIAASSTPHGAAHAERAGARGAAEPTGLRLCGIADEPPRPPSAASATSPTSVCASSTMSSATFSTRAGGDRQRRAELGDAARGRRATAAAARRARAARRSAPATAGPRRRARPACRPRRRAAPASGSSRSRSRASATPASQPAALSPKVVGSACCSSVRPAIGVAAVLVGQPRAGAPRPRRARRAISTERARARPASPRVSRMSWLVAPRWT